MPDTAKIPIGFFEIIYFFFLIAASVLLHMALHGTSWVIFEDGTSGLWAHCNTSDLDAFLHLTRAALIMACILWWLGALLRFVTWGKRGADDERPVIFLPLVTSLLELTAGLLFGLGLYPAEYEDDPEEYRDVHLTSNYIMVYFASAIAACAGVLALKLHLDYNPRSSLNFLRRIKASGRLRGCFNLRATAPSSTTTSGGGGSAATATTATAVRGAGGSIEIAVVSTSSVGDLPSRQGRARAHRNRREADTSSDASTGSQGSSPEVAATLPPAYEDVIGEEDMRFGTTLSPPPLYEEVMTDARYSK